MELSYNQIYFYNQKQLYTNKGTYNIQQISKVYLPKSGNISKGLLSVLYGNGIEVVEENN